MLKSQELSDLTAHVIIRKIQDVGRIEEKLRSILDMDIFEINQLSKHNTYFQSEYEKEDEKLQHLRMTFSEIEQSLYELLDLINNEPHGY